MGRSISPMSEDRVAGSDPRAAPRLIVPMSLRLTIPRRVALQQSSPPLDQSKTTLKEKRLKEAGIRKSLKNRCTLGDAELLEAWAMLQKQARALVRLPAHFQIEKRISKCYVV